MSDDLYIAAKRVVSLLAAAGYESYFAGGCVRDRILGIVPEEYDVATAARPDQVRNIFPRARRVGEAFGVMLVRQDEYMFDVATFRTDGSYADHRRPDSVTFSDAQHDAARRDFTINGLFENPINGEVIDLVNGRADLEAGVIRAIGDPRKRLDEDHLRMLRAVRFAARFDFAIEDETASAIQTLAGELQGVSRERIGQEVRRMLSHESRGVAAREVQHLGLDESALMEPSCANAPTRLERLPAAAEYGTALAAWALDRHEAGLEDRTLIDRWRKALSLSNRECDALAATLEVRRSLDAWDDLGTALRKRLAVSPCFGGALEILEAEDPAKFAEICRSVDALAESGLAPRRLLSGDDLVAAGIPPSPALGKALQVVYDAQLEGSIDTFDEALALARAFLKEPT